MCAQPCRLPYELIDETGRSWSKPGRERALCPRDTCTADMLPRLLDAGAHALKLEGRMKAPDYVHSIVSAYRAQLDDILAGREILEETAQARYRQLKRCFNRDFTTEYQEGRSGDEMMSYERSNNRGQIVGEVLGSKPLGNTKASSPTTSAGAPHGPACAFPSRSARVICSSSATMTSSTSSSPPSRPTTRAQTTSSSAARRAPCPRAPRAPHP